MCIQPPLTLISLNHNTSEVVIFTSVCDKSFTTFTFSVWNGWFFFFFSFCRTMICPSCTEGWTTDLKFSAQKCFLLSRLDRRTVCKSNPTRKFGILLSMWEIKRLTLELLHSNSKTSWIFISHCYALSRTCKRQTETPQLLHMTLFSCSTMRVEALRWIHSAPFSLQIRMRIRIFRVWISGGHASADWQTCTLREERRKTMTTKLCRENQNGSDKLKYMWRSSKLTAVCPRNDRWPFSATMCVLFLQRLYSFFLLALCVLLLNSLTIIFQQKSYLIVFDAFLFYSFFLLVYSH